MLDMEAQAIPNGGTGTDERLVPFVTDDGVKLNLIHVRDPRGSARGPVLLVHGAGVRANIFRAPVKTTLVDALLAEGYDVWLENWRASTDMAPNEWTLEQAALYDHPAAVATVLRETGAKSLKAVIHCQGSTSFTMAAVAGLLPAVDTIVSMPCPCTRSCRRGRGSSSTCSCPQRASSRPTCRPPGG